MRSNHKLTQPRKRSNRKRSDKYHPSPRPYNLAPPTYITQLNRTWRIRMLVSAAAPFGQTIAMNTLAGIIGVIATSATTSVFLCDQFRLRRVCMWGPVATAGVPVTCMIKYVDDPASNTQSGAPKTVSDTSISFDRPAYVCLEPPKDNTSIFSQWMDSSLTTTVLTVWCPNGTTIDFDFNFIIDDVGQTSIGPALAAATTGVIYHKTFALGGATVTVANGLNGI